MERSPGFWRKSLIFLRCCFFKGSKACNLLRPSLRNVAVWIKRRDNPDTYLRYPHRKNLHARFRGTFVLLYETGF